MSTAEVRGTAVKRGGRRGPRVGGRQVAWAAAVPLAAAWLAATTLGTRYSPMGMALDALVLLSLLLALRLSARGPIALWMTCVLYALLLVAAPAFKVAQLQVPILAADGTALVALLQVLSGWRLWLAATLLAGVALLAAWAWWPRRGGWHGLLLAAGVAAAWIVGAGGIDAGLDRAAPLASPDDLVERLERRGGGLFLMADFADYRREKANVPDARAVDRALEGLSPPRMQAGPAFRPRNVHVVLIETAWDPLLLGHYRFSRDPFDPRFRRAMQQSKGSAALVPGFGGATANAEFEVLCGLPATRDQVAFEHDLARPMPCLPRLLREAGYLATASHPYRADFWSRDSAYPLLGFERYYPVNAFELDDMDGMFLADASTYRQVLERLDQENDPRPVFNYVVSLSSHYPYERAAHRPDRITVTPKAPLLEAHANAIAYSTEAFMDYVEAIQARDPDALVVGFGDHAPVLGHAPDPFELSGIVMPTRRDAIGASPLIESPAHSRVPLLVFDGRKGVVPVGELPLFALADLVLSRLGEDAPRTWLSAFRDAGLDASRTRMFLGHMLIRPADRWQLCRGKHPGCNAARALRERLVLLRQDLARGEQHALAWLAVPELASATDMALEKPHADCGLEVVAWGPRDLVRGAGFNVQADGSSSFWFQLESARGQPLLRIGDDIRVPITVAGLNASAGLDPATRERLRDGDALAWTCPDGSEGPIGQLAIREAVVAPAPVVPPAAGCAAGVQDIGPREIHAGEAFNVQPDGRSAVWLALTPGSRGFELKLAGQPVQYFLADGMATFSVDETLAPHLRRPGAVPLELSCEGEVVARAEITVR